MIIKPLANIKREIKPYITFKGYPVNVNDVFFFDVETVPEYQKLSELLKHNPEKYKLFVEKYNSLKKFDAEYSDKSEAEVYENHTGLMAEYCKVVCISFGYVSKDGFKTGSIAIDNVNFHTEREVIETFAAILSKSKKNTLAVQTFLCSTYHCFPKSFLRMTYSHLRCFGHTKQNRGLLPQLTYQKYGGEKQG